MDVLLSVCLGIGLAAAAGFRIFLPLLALSVAAYLGWVDLNENWLWLGGWQTLILLGLATVLELLAYYIPWFDNALDTIAVPLATVAGTILFFVTLGNFDPWVSWALAIIGGGGTAGLIAGSTATARAASTTTTMGFANPVFATLEAVFSTFLSILALIFPILALILVIYIIYRLVRFFRKRKRNSDTKL
ncbi:DUF4126 domain-containing protein [Leeuwenhoekiella parthenopeia]|uniref:DUF4126 domain-containing protein n=1 Tax=Leeuwenhoekiella parthenopeia TaxID=2890320 RepID=A0ABS8GTN2_9FLAO|nr:DUF4126 domain-containing protein [Leeuwenhoekiella parthenopeia]MCC4213351.1 DUF4126 domain-containing protein [Leeuwenhoekiella parthenopeia]